MTQTSILGKNRHFELCEIVQLHNTTNETFIEEETVTIIQVDHGLKFVEAETMMGAVFGLGFIHAKDRLWQMHFYKFLCQGRLSEIIGSGGVEIDKYVRTIGFPRAARTSWDKISPGNRILL